MEIFIKLSSLHGVTIAFHVILCNFVQFRRIIINQMITMGWFYTLSHVISAYLIVCIGSKCIRICSRTCYTYQHKSSGKHLQFDIINSEQLLEHFAHSTHKILSIEYQLVQSKWDVKKRQFRARHTSGVAWFICIGIGPKIKMSQNSLLSFFEDWIAQKMLFEHIIVNTVVH